MSWLKRLFGAHETPREQHSAHVFLTNTLGGKKELFIPLKPRSATLYSCGPTVYGPAHIGNLRPYIFSDTLARTLEAAGYRVRRVINITDFGHLVSDGDEGEDKMTKGLKREGMELTMENMKILAERYAKGFIEDLETLNIDTDDITFPRASEYVQEQIALIHTLEEKGYAYRTRDGVYFDTSRFPGYGKLGGIRLDAQREGARVEINKEKRHPADFVLWKSDPRTGWESEWGRGFPGWHIECSTMSRVLLGQEIDIHTGGEDHIAVHHNNEIAQSEAASGRTFVHYWLHNAFLTMDGEKASKSIGNVEYLSDLVQHGYHPLALRYFFLQAHYRTPLSFSFDALDAAASALERLWRLADEIAKESKRESAPSEATDRFLANMRDDLGTPQALGVLWDSLKNDEYTPEEKWGLLEAAEAHLGLSLLSPPLPTVLTKEMLPREIQDLLEKRENARKTKDFKESDRLRDELKNSGYTVEDRPNEQVVTKSAA